MQLLNVIWNRNTQERKLKKLRSQFNKHVNIYISDSRKISEFAQKLFFGYEKNHDDGSITVHYKGDPWLSGIMRDIGIFESISSAKGAGWHKKAQNGFMHEIITIKKIPHNICIYKEAKKSLTE